MTVREAKRADAQAIADVAKACFSKPLTEADFRETMENPDKCLLTAEDGQIVGYVLLTLLGEEAEVYSVAVSPEARRQGTGRALMEAGMRNAKETGAERLFLEVRAGNTPALRLYTALGFEKLGIRKNYYSAPREDAVIMAADLGSLEERSEENEHPCH